MNKTKEKRKFHYRELCIELHPYVYEPAEDTFLLADSIEIKPGMKILELGSGCGLIALACAQKGADVICTDINPFAVDLIKRNYLHNKNLLRGPLHVCQSDLFSNIARNERFDGIIFNPPYLPIKPKEKIESWLNLAVNGGYDGLQVITRFIKCLGNFLTIKGKAYFVFSSLASEQKLLRLLKKEHLTFSILKQQRFEDEVLSVYCIYSDTLK